MLVHKHTVQHWAAVRFQEGASDRICPLLQDSDEEEAPIAKAAAPKEASPGLMSLMHAPIELRMLSVASVCLNLMTSAA